MKQTDFIAPSERCFGLIEQNRLMDGENGARAWRRVQAVIVVRDDKPAEYVTDLGSAFLWETVPEQYIYASGEEVALIQHEAERGRHDDYGYKLMRELQEGSTLVADFLQEKEENWERIKNRSHFGPVRTKQRNGFPQALRRK